MSPQAQEDVPWMEGATRGLEIPALEASWGFKGKNYLFTIGIDEYRYWNPLKCAVKDVKDFTAILLERYQFENQYCVSLLDKEATLQNVLLQFRELFRKVTPEDNLIIYFSGHGHFDELTKTGYWIPVEAQKGIEYEHEFINTAVIFDKLKNINTLHTFLIIDACFSGTLLHQIRSEPKSERYKSRLVFASGRAEVVSDGQAGSNSPFAKGILTTLTLNTDKHISASKLIVEAKEYVEKEAQQTPTDARLINANDQGGDFVFHLKMSEAEIWANVVRQDTQEVYQSFLEQFPGSVHRLEAQESLDWLLTKETNTIQQLQSYLNKYQPHGKFVPLAIAKLDEVEEELCWEKTKNKNTLAAYFRYLSQYPSGKYVEVAKVKTTQMDKDEDDKAFEKALEKATPDAYEDYINKPDTNKYIDEAKKKLLQLTEQSSEPSEEEKAWKQVQANPTYKIYHNFTQAFPQSLYLNEALIEMRRMDDIALNQVRLAESNKSLSIQDKIDRCIDYFDRFPGADNNAKVKQIKDLLEIQKIRRGRR